MRALQQARQEAAALGHPYVGTEHLLLGILAYRDGRACLALANLGVDVSRAVDLVLARVQRGARDRRGRHVNV